MAEAPPGIDPALLRAWLDARSISRGLPLSVVDHGGFRVDSAQPDEARRYVFAHADWRITALARSISAPRVLIKLCGPGATLQALLPQGWHVRPPSWFMATNGEMALPPARLTAGYEAIVERAGALCTATIRDADGVVAASGRALLHRGVFVYDQIQTAPDHRRKGLASAVMRLLQAAGRGGAATQALTATPDGRQLYEALGWRVVSEYCTGEIIG